MIEDAILSRTRRRVRRAFDARDARERSNEFRLTESPRSVNARSRPPTRARRRRARTFARGVDRYRIRDRSSSRALERRVRTRDRACAGFYRARTGCVPRRRHGGRLERDPGRVRGDEHRAHGQARGEPNRVAAHLRGASNLDDRSNPGRSRRSMRAWKTHSGGRIPYSTLSKRYLRVKSRRALESREIRSNPPGSIDRASGGWLRRANARESSRLTVDKFRAREGS